MTVHKKEDSITQEEANFYPVDGIRGHCTCGHYFHFISGEGEKECPECGAVYNVYVDHDIWKVAE